MHSAGDRCCMHFHLSGTIDAEVAHIQAENTGQVCRILKFLQMCNWEGQERDRATVGVRPPKTAIDATGLQGGPEGGVPIPFPSPIFFPNPIPAGII